MTCSFTGIGVPLVTPFHDGAIDFDALRCLARRMADAGVAGLVVCGSTGEAATLSQAEQLAALDAVLEAAPISGPTCSCNWPAWCGPASWNRRWP